MSQENPSICKECKHYLYYNDSRHFAGGEIKFSSHYCIAKIKEKFDHASSETFLNRIKDCQRENPNGECSLFELKEDINE
jgi:hypothetical protein